MVDNGVRADWTYGTYLRLDELLALQGDDRGISNDELHFIIVHQTLNCGSSRCRNLRDQDSGRFRSS